MKIQYYGKSYEYIDITVCVRFVIVCLGGTNFSDFIGNERQKAMKEKKKT